MRKPRALDLFCGAGGASRGLQLAGFHVTGVDINPQPHYCGDDFVQGDALNPPFDPTKFDFIWASPKCQAHTRLAGMWNARTHEDQIPETRELLRAAGCPYVIENVIGAPLENPFMLCGTMFGLQTECGAQLERHRLFEANWWVGLIPPCSHGTRTLGVYGEGARDNSSDTRRRVITVTGHTPQQNVVYNQVRRTYGVAAARVAMGIDWMTIAELCQAIPPAYSEFIGRAALAHINHREAA